MKRDTIFELIAGVADWYWSRPWLVLATTIVLLPILGHRVYIDSQIWGSIPGASRVEVEVLDAELSSLNQRSDTTKYYLRLKEVHDGSAEIKRTKVSKKTWEKTAVGTKLTAFKVRGSPKTYLKDSLFGSRQDRDMYVGMVMGLPVFLLSCSVFRLIWRLVKKGDLYPVNDG